MSSSDQALIADVANTLAIPKVDPASSFVLHAPLELLARALLLPHVRSSSRRAALDQIRALGVSYSSSGPAVATPAPVTGLDSQELAARLIRAISAGELDDADRYALALGRAAKAVELRHLAGSVVTSLAAAGHASILFSLLPRVTAARGDLIRGVARELARHPDWQLSWFDEAAGPIAGSLLDALLDIPVLGEPGSNFIYPVMSQAESSGLAAKLLSGIDASAHDASRDLSRVAAWSMLQEGPEHAPFGWTHCLTMPQAVMALAGDGVEPRIAVAVAATYVVGFRSALGTGPLVPDYDPAPCGTDDLAEAIGAGPAIAAAAAWHASDRDELRTELATGASLHPDAHLVKYTLACFDAAAADTSAERLFLAAAASLAGWWAQHPDG